MRLKNILIFGCIFLVIFTIVSVVSAKLLLKKVEESTVVYKKIDNKEIEELLKSTSDEDTQVDIYKDEEEDKNNLEDEEDISVAKSNEENVSPKTVLSLLGEIDLSGQVSNNLNFDYVQGIKKVYNNTLVSDFAYANFVDNISEDATIDTNSKNLAGKNATNFLRALSLSAVSIASDNMLNYGMDSFNTTVEKIKSENIYVAGKKDEPVYFKKGDTLIAIISTNSVIKAGVDYNGASISTYSKENVLKNIKEAKKNASFVIVDFHWGNESAYGVTDNMRQMAIFAIENGADMVIGTHAAGVYPIVTYNNKPIIYSLGSFISDSDLYVKKEGFIFNLTIDKDKMEKLEMLPIYVNNKQEVLLFNDYSKEMSDEYLEQFNKWNIDNSLNSTIENNKIVINF